MIYSYSVNELDNVVKFIDSIITIDDQYLKAVERAIKISMNKNYTTETVERLSKSQQNIRSAIHLLDKHVNNFQGIVFEKIEVYNYNYLKNRENVITITNPDPTSKSDIIHIINQESYSLVECGPDVKYSGDEAYVVNQYIEKHLKREDSKGFIDITGYLDDKDYVEGVGFKKLSKGYNKKVLKAINEYGYKPTISPVIPRAQFEQIFIYYVNYLRTGKLPSETSTGELREIIKMKNNNDLRSYDLITSQSPNQECILLSDTIKTIRDSRVKVNNESDKLIDQNSKNVIENESENAEKKLTNSNKEGQVKIEQQLLKKSGKGYFRKSIDSIVNSCKANKGKIIGFCAITVGVAATAGVLINKKRKSISYMSEDIDEIEDDESDGTVIYDEEDNEFSNNENSSNNFNGEGLSETSVFKSLYNAFKENEINQSEFHDEANKLKQETGKNPNNYLRFLKNVKHEKSAEELLDYEVEE